MRHPIPTKLPGQVLMSAGRRRVRRAVVRVLLGTAAIDSRMSDASRDRGQVHIPGGAP